MYVDEIYLYHFKNYLDKKFSFTKQFVCITGNNGMGKTNLLDAIYYICFTKSYLVHQDSYCISNGKNDMRIKAILHDINSSEIQCIIRENERKEFTNNGVAYAQLSKHIGKYPVVIITPDDTNLITDTSEHRRKFIDMLIAQTNEEYLASLIKYNKILNQRNALLKNWQKQVSDKESMIAVYDSQLHEASKPIYNLRKIFTEKVKSKTLKYVQFLCDNNEEAEIEYQSHLHNNSLLSLLNENKQKDIITMRTNVGIHKDDLIFTLNKMPLKTVASQGQRKSFLFGLKFAQFEIMNEILHTTPLLLLDDIFEKLDEKRSEKILKYIQSLSTQVFITDTHKYRLEKAFNGLEKSTQWIELTY